MSDFHSLNDQQRYDLLQFGHNSLSLLATDELWTEAARTGDPFAPELGRQMQDLMERLMRRSNEVAALLFLTQSEVDVYWPDLRESWRQTSNREITALDWWLRTEYFGLLGTAGATVARTLGDSLADEIGLVAQGISVVEHGSPSDGDLSRNKKILIGVVAVCCLVSVALPAIAAAVMAGGLAAGVASGAVQAGAVSGVTNLASVAAGFAGSAVLGPPAPVTITRAEQLEKLKALLDNGGLTLEEYEAEKAKVLNSP